MPILKENLKRYPKDWHSRVRPMVMARSGGRCECSGQCGRHVGRCTAEHHIWGVWEAPGEFVALNPQDLSYWIDEEGVLPVWIVLTVMHLDHTPENNDPANLLHGCQRCHNTYDAPHRAETRRRRNPTPDLFQA